MGIGGQREGAEASVEKQYAHTNVIDTLEVTCTTRNRTRVTQAECLLVVELSGRIIAN